MMGAIERPAIDAAAAASVKARQAAIGAQPEFVRAVRFDGVNDIVRQAIGLGVTLHCGAVGAGEVQQPVAGADPQDQAVLNTVIGNLNLSNGHLFNTFQGSK